MSSAHGIIMDRAQGGRKDLASLDEPTVELRLDTLMPPLLLAELCELDQSRDLSLQNSKIGSTGAGVKIPLLISTLSCAKAILGFYEIYVPTHDFILPAPPPSPPGYIPYIPPLPVSSITAAASVPPDSQSPQVRQRDRPVPSPSHTAQSSP
jgi:hypothetical protein